MDELIISEEDMQRMKEALESVTEAIQTVADAIVQVFKQIADNLCKVISQWWDNVLKCFGNKRVVHLAFHSKKERIRKKNRNRLLKEFWKMVTLETAKGNT